jgi:capsular exopolysaccharide synthesis family protein
MNPPRSTRSNNDLRNYNSEIFIEERDDFDFREQLDVFWRRKWIVIGIAFLILALGAGYTLTRKPVYEATAKLALATTSPKSMTDLTSDPLSTAMDVLGDSRTVETQVEIMKSQDLLDKAFNNFDDRTKMKGFGATEIPTWSYEIDYKENSDVVSVIGKAYTARLAADMANQIVQTYRSNDRMLNQATTQKTRVFVEQEMKKRLAELNAATKDLADYKTKTGLIDATTQVQNAANTYNLLLAQKSEAQTGLNSAERSLDIYNRQLRIAQPDVDAARTVQENPEFTASRTHLMTLQAERSEKLEEYTPNAPEIQALDNQIKQEEEKMRGITRRIVTSQSSARNPALDKIGEGYIDALTQRATNREKLSAANSSLQRMLRQLDKFPAQQRDLALLQQKVTGLEDAYKLLSDRYSQLKIAENGTPDYVTQISEARVPKFKSYPKVLQNLIGFLFLGLLAGIGAAMLRERLDTRVHDPFVVDRITGLTSLSAIPETEPTEDASVPGKLLIGQVENNHAFVESFRLLRNNIMFSSPDKEIKLLGVTSPSKSEGKSTIAVNLAIALAMDGKRVLIIDCDLRRPTIHGWMNVGREIGLTSVVKNITTLEDAIKPTPFPNLDCLTSGPLPPNPTEFLNSEQTKMLFEQASNMYDIVVLDSPPCTGLSDVQVISTVADGMVLVVSLNSTTKQSLVATTRMLRQAGAPMLGTAINRIQYKRSSYGYYAYSYYYYYSQYEEDEEATKKKKKRRKKKPLETANKG